MGNGQLEGNVGSKDWVGGRGLEERGFKRVTGTGGWAAEQGKTDGRNTDPWIGRRGLMGREGGG